MAEEIKSFLISFGTYLFFTFAWWALKAGFDAGELLDCMFSFIPLFEVRSDEGLTYIIFFFPVYRRLRNRFPDALEEDRYAIKWSR